MIGDITVMCSIEQDVNELANNSDLLKVMHIVFTLVDSLMSCN